MLFSRLTDESFPVHLEPIVDTIDELIEVIRDLSDDKLMINPKNELVMIIEMGKKTKEFAITLEKADISNEESMKRKIEELEKQLDKTTFEATFFREQY